MPLYTRKLPEIFQLSGKIFDYFMLQQKKCYLFGVLKKRKVIIVDFCDVNFMEKVNKRAVCLKKKEVQRRGTMSEGDFTMLEGGITPLTLMHG